jgi:competence protein ComEC
MKRIVLVSITAFLLIISLSAFAESSVLTYLDISDDLPALGVSGQLEVHLINVGPADCILLRCDNQTMLVDSGLPENYERIIKYLQSINVDRLDYAFATHPHIDHIGGFVGVLETLPVETLLWPPLYDAFESAIQAKLFALIEKESIPIRMIEHNSVMSLGGAQLTFMQWQNPSASVNDRSMIIKAKYGDRAILLMADLENAGQSAIIAEYGDRLRADIIKMPHHGLTSYTRDVNTMVSPSLGVSTNGLGVSSTFDAYRKYGVKYLITISGTVVAVTGGTEWSVWQIPNK